MNGTRRMWSRRVLRAGWLIAPLFTMPGRIYRAAKPAVRNFFFDRYGNFKTADVIGCLIVATIFGLMVFAIASMANDMNKYSRHATSEMIKEAAASDPCVAKELVDTVNGGAVIKEYTIEVAQLSCKKQRSIEKQKETLGLK